jgi:hypothetical protein
VGSDPLPLGIARFVFILRENEVHGEYPSETRSHKIKAAQAVLATLTSCAT